MATQPFVIERTFNAPVAKVWAALTDSKKMKEWYFDIPDFKAEPGFEFQFEGGDPDGEKYVHHCKIKTVEPEKKLAYTWRYENVPGESLLTFELFPEGKKTRLKLTHAGLETFVTDKKDFGRESFAAGWTQIIGTNLENYLAKE